MSLSQPCLACSGVKNRDFHIKLPFVFPQDDYKNYQLNLYLPTELVKICEAYWIITESECDSKWEFIQQHVFYDELSNYMKKKKAEIPSIFNFRNTCTGYILISFWILFTKIPYMKWTVFHKKFNWKEYSKSNY